jgi:hypothetical protein
MSAPDATPADTPPSYFTDPASPLAPYFLRAWPLAGFALLAGVFVVLNFSPLWHTDTWGHIKYGEWMVRQGGLPEHEPFCDLADKQSPYIAFGWLSQVLFYLTLRFGEWIAGGDGLNQLAGGVDILRGLHAALSAVRWGLLLLALRRISGSTPLACFGTLLSMLLMWANYGVLRPQVMVEPLFAVMLLLVGRQPISRRAVLFVPLLMLLWVNLHGSFLVGLAFLGCLLLGRVAGLVLSERGLAMATIAKDAAVRRLLMALLFATLACVVNPHGPMLFGHTLALAQHPNIADMDEWQGIEWTTGRGVLFAGSLVLLGLTLVLRLNRRSISEGAEADGVCVRTLFATHLLLILLFGVQTLLHQRWMHWWGMLVPWLLAPHCALLSRNIPWLQADLSTPSFRKTVLAVGVWLIALRFSGPVQVLLDREPRPLEKSLHADTPWHLAALLANRGGTSPDSAARALPKVAAWLAKQPGGRFTGRVYCTETLGDYLLWALPSDVPITMYTHVHLFPADTWKEFLRIKFGANEWERLLERQNVGLVVFESEQYPRFRRNLDAAKERWEIIHDATLVIAVRKPAAPPSGGRNR